MTDLPTILEALTAEKNARADYAETMNSRPSIPHAARCGRRGAPILRLSWAGRPQAWCPDCGRYADLPDPDEHTEQETTR